jgi:hypothetical protein
MFSWWILHDCSLEVVLIIFRVKNEVHLSTKGTYSTIFYTLHKTIVSCFLLSRVCYISLFREKTTTIKQTQLAASSWWCCSKKE